VISKVTSAQKALAELDKIKDKASLLFYLPYYTTRAELHYQNNEAKIAHTLLQEALKLPTKANMKSLLNRKLEEYAKNI